MEQNSPSRKRGDRLIESIYDATVEIIRTEGYANLTFQKVARLAQTSRTVLYRRWATPLDMIREMTVHRSSQALGGELTDQVKDTGSLRGDILYLMELHQKIYVAVGSEIMNAMLFEIGQHNTQMPTIKGNVDFRNMQAIEKVLGFAKARGEKVKTLSEPALTLPFDLMRIGYLCGQPALDKAALKQLVDEILLPVLTY